MDICTNSFPQILLSTIMKMINFDNPDDIISSSCFGQSKDTSTYIIRLKDNQKIRGKVIDIKNDSVIIYNNCNYGT